MANVGGSITLNGIGDRQLIAILEVKEKNRSVQFNPQVMQPQQRTIPGQHPEQFYNNVILTWSPEGFATIRDLMSRLIEMT